MANVQIIRLRYDSTRRAGMCCLWLLVFYLSRLISCAAATFGPLALSIPLHIRKSTRDALCRVARPGLTRSYEYDEIDPIVYGAANGISPDESDEIDYRIMSKKL